MTQLVHVTGALAAVLNGVAAGIMLSTVIGIVPMMLTMPYQRYVQTVRFLWPRYDPLMPILNGTALVLVVVSAALAGRAPSRPAFVVAAVLLATVVTISITKNVPVNRFVSGLDPGEQPGDWSRLDPRARWRTWNLVRTALALLAFTSTVTATALLA
jgi:uncharacterized membrane protein